MRRPRPFAAGRAIVAGIVADRRARRTYHALCRENRAPMVSVHIRLETDRYDDWTGMQTHGLYGLKTSGIPLTRDGLRYIDKIPRDIRRTCIRELRRIHAEEESR